MTDRTRTDLILAMCYDQFGVTLDELKAQENKSSAVRLCRKVVHLLVLDMTGLTRRENSELLGKKFNTGSVAAQRLIREMEVNGALRRLVNGMKQDLRKMGV